MSEAIPSWARIGAKVVCIRGGTQNSTAYTKFGVAYPTTNEVVTITKAFVNPWGRAVLDLVEYPSPQEGWGWQLERFRPLASQADDISTHFAHLLDTRAPELV